MRGKSDYSTFRSSAAAMIVCNEQVDELHEGNSHRPMKCELKCKHKTENRRPGYLKK